MKSDYIFNFNIETATSEFDLLRITFPENFDDPALGITDPSACVADDLTTGDVFLSCSVSDYVIEI